MNPLLKMFECKEDYIDKHNEQSYNYFCCLEVMINEMDCCRIT